MPSTIPRIRRAPIRHCLTCAVSNGLPVALLKVIEHAGQAQLLEGRGRFRTGIHGRLVDQQGLEVATEATAVDVGIGERLRGLCDGLAFQTFVQNRLDGSPSGAGMCQSPFACGIQPGITILAAKPDDALCATQIDEHLVVEERRNQRIARWTAFFGLRQTPLRLVFEPRLRCRRLMITDGRARVAGLT